MKHGRKTPVDESGAYPSPYDAYLHGLSATTRRRMSAALRRAAKILSVDPEKCVWNKLEPDQVALVRDELTAQGASPTTINVALSAIRGVARAACGRDPDALTREEIGRLEAIRSIQNVPVKRDSALEGLLVPRRCVLCSQHVSEIIALPACATRPCSYRCIRLE